MIFDTHMHCNYSCDSRMNFDDAILAAKEKNIGIIITEHWDYDYPTNPDAFTFDIQDYFTQFKPLTNDNILIGIEIGMQIQTLNIDNKIAHKNDFDYILGSIHCAGGYDLYEPNFYKGSTRQEVINIFLRDAISCVEQDRDFDAFAHIDYICRYWPYQGKDRELHLDDAPEFFDKFFKVLISKDIPLEINTRRLDNELSVASLIPLYKRYHKLGGLYCTIGSDAHYAQHVGRRLDKALNLAKICGLQPVYFKQRKKIMMEDY